MNGKNAIYSSEWHDLHAHCALQKNKRVMVLLFSKCFNRTQATQAHELCVCVGALACFSKCVSLSRDWIKKLNIYTQIAQWSQDQRASFGNMTSSVRIKKIFITLSEVCQCLRYVNHQYNTIGGLCPQFMENNQLLRTFSAYIDFVVVHFVLKYFKFIFVSFICIKVT